MVNYILEATNSTPFIELTTDGRMKIKGRSIHENVPEFYEPAMKWCKEYIENPPELTIFDIKLEYFNSSSAKTIIQLLKEFKLVQNKGKKFVINWYYEDGDDDILERGEYLAFVLNMRFNIMVVK